jgi:two-component system phosphate regulon sensor histidine kinase PhoR
VLEFGRLQSRARRLELAPERVDDVVQFALREFEALRLGAPAKVTSELEPELVVLAERRAFVQVLVNLLSNAFKYGGQGKPITVRAWRDHRRVAIAVDDEGPGVPFTLRRRIFRPFVRGDDAETASKPGTGLGLAISHRLVAAQRGALRYEPRHGGGSRFIITLRAVDAPAPAVATAAPQPNPTEGTRP